jgi:hypothetical protein
MSNVSSRHLVIARVLRLRRLFSALAFLVLAVLPNGFAAAQDIIRVDRSVARSWGLQQIALIQAAQGDIAGALNTIASINDPEVVRGAGDVTGVCFCGGVPFYDHPPAPADWFLFSQPGTEVFSARDRAPTRVPKTVPQGLPADYLAADPRHGAVVSFSDEYDSHGTRVTSRRYADGHIMIDTPRQKSR